MNKLIKIFLVMIVCGANLGCGQTETSQDYPTVSPAEFIQDVRGNKDVYVLDVRTPREYAQGHLQEAHNLDWLNQSAFEAGLPSLPKDQTIYIYCRSGGRSAKASKYLSQRGYKVVNLAGGFSDLQKASL